MTAAPHVFRRVVAAPTEATHPTGRRVVATIIDGLVLGFGYYLLAQVFGDTGTEGDTTNWVNSLPVLANIAYGVFVVGYYVLLEGCLGQTFGKSVVGIQVVAEATGEAPGIAAAAIRTLLRIIDGLLGYAVAFVFVTVLAQAKRQRLGDMAAQTLVIRS